MSITLETVRQMSAPEKIRSFAEIPEIIRRLGEAGVTVVLAQGVFDIVHLGHVGYLQASRSVDPENGIVIVGVENDDTVRSNKGDSRPVNALEDRLRVLAEFMSTGLVFAYEDTPRYERPEDYIDRYKAIGPALISVPVWDPHLDLKTYQASEADSHLALVNYRHTNSTTRMLREVGYEE